MKEIELSKTGKKYKGMYKASVDDDVFDEVNQYGWSYCKGYAYNSKMSILLHCYIYELKFGDIPDNKEVEHIDRNRLNCQLSNLRLATRKENCRNRSKPNTNTSGYLGVCKEVDKKEKEDGIHINEYWFCQWTDSEGKRKAKPFPYTNAGKVLAARHYDLKTSQSAGEYTGELNFNSLEEYQHELKKAILKDLENNS